MKKQILIVYSKMVVGGSTTSLLSLLNTLNDERVAVELQLYSNRGELQNRIPSQVTVLPALETQAPARNKRYNLRYWRDGILARCMSRIKKNRLLNAQFMAYHEAICYPKNPKHYDAGISFLEFFPMEYLAYQVEADRKIGWIHIDVKEGGLLPRGEKTFQKLDKLVLVSQSCVKSFLSLFPSMKEKVCCVENILASETVRSLSKAECTPLAGDLVFVTVCRLVLASKGLDRGVNAFGRLKKEGLLQPGHHWYLIGDGQDRETLESMIQEQSLEEHIHLLGQQRNPYRLEKDADVFLLPSRYEGKPMAVTEAQMLGVVPLVCEYSSAREQIEDGVTGMIAKNDEEDIYEKLKAVLTGEVDLDAMKRELRMRDYTNIQTAEQIYRLLEL